jgi:hypothetical protein
MVCHPMLKVTQFGAVSELDRQLGNELRLIAGPPHEQHQSAGDCQGGVVTKVLLDQSERQVHARRDSGRGRDVAVPKVRCSR